MPLPLGVSFFICMLLAVMKILAFLFLVILLQTPCNVICLNENDINVSFECIFTAFFYDTDLYTMYPIYI